MSPDADIAIVGAGAAGLMAAICAGRTARQREANLRIVVLDGAAKLGAKILVSGGGRCNVTHDQVDAAVFAGSSVHAVRKVLRRFDAAATIEFFDRLGVRLKREETGKLFPTTDSARTVLDALLRAVAEAGAIVRNLARVEMITPDSTAFRIDGPFGGLTARRVILATGGKSLPKTGSDGVGFEIVRTLGHSITPLVTPALVPLLVDRSHFICGLSGLSVDTRLEVRSGSGKRFAQMAGSTLCTHFGLSGPGPLDVSRYYLHARHGDRDARLVINWLPGETTESLDRHLVEQSTRGAAPIARIMPSRLPQRLIAALCQHAEISPTTSLTGLGKGQRRAFVAACTQMHIPVTGDRGYGYAEVTAGGVPLTELRLETMESRACKGLYLCGEMCDVDGPIGGYNFQWAWASGHVAGTAAAQAAIEPQCEQR